MKRTIFASVLAIGLGLIVTGCVAPIGAERVTTRQAYEQVTANALRTGKPSAQTVTVLHRYELDRLAERRPDEAVRQLHQKAVATGDRDLLFALSELSYVAGEQIRHSVKPWDPRDARDYYLGSAVYAWLFLFGDGKQAPPGAFDRRFRNACDFYNYSLGLALTGWRSTNAAVLLQSGRRRLPVGEVQLELDTTRFVSALGEFDSFLLADHFRVRGMSVRNRDPGIGAPLICVREFNPEFGLSASTPATAFLRGPTSLTQLAGGTQRCSLELYSALDTTLVTIGTASVPLEVDLTTYRAYTLNQARIWKLGRLAFLAPAENIANQLILHQPYEPDRIPVVFVHGTFSSPVTWAEMANTLTADPVFRRRYQIWSYVYGSSNPLLVSAADFRKALTEKVHQLDPEGTNVFLRQMVIVGHSQGGLLTKSTAINTGDRLWRIFSTKSLDSLNVPEAEREELRRLTFYEPLPFVKVVVFIATPHRGSYLSGNLARRLGRKLVSLPAAVVSRGAALLVHTEGSEASRFLGKKMPTSLDGMSPRNPALLAMAEVPVSPHVKAYSIIPVLGDGDPQTGGRDGVVAYSSAHLDHVESEVIVRSHHSCLNQPATIEEVRRILYEHLDHLK